jgi:hypothetical protein
MINAQPPHRPIVAKKPLRSRIKTPLKARNVARPQNLARHRLIPIESNQADSSDVDIETGQ